MAGDDENYAGDVSCDECWEMLAAEANAQLVDVRTKPEWAYVGVPVLTSLGKETIRLEWQSYPEMGVDPEFAKRLNAELDSQGTGKGDPVLFFVSLGREEQIGCYSIDRVGLQTKLQCPWRFRGRQRRSGPSWQSCRLEEYRSALGAKMSA